MPTVPNPTLADLAKHLQGLAAPLASTVSPLRVWFWPNGSRLEAERVIGAVIRCVRVTAAQDCGSSTLGHAYFLGAYSSPPGKTHYEGNRFHSKEMTRLILRKWLVEYRPYEEFDGPSGWSASHRCSS